MPQRKRFDRVLYYYPIIHAQTELGTLGDISRQIIKDKIGQEFLVERMARINQLWEQIGKSANELTIDYQRTRIYQDGLPICGYEDNIVSDLAKQGSINHQIILDLQKKGSTLMGTESPDLLLNEYHLMKEMLLDGNTSKGTTDQNKFREKQALLLHQRDEFIANRINETLCQGESGILFLGVLHAIEAQLNKGIHVIHPIDLRSTTNERII